MWKKWLRKHNIECVLFLIFLAGMLSFVAMKGFWYDEIVMLGFLSRPKLTDLFPIYSGMEVSNLPLYAVFMWLIYHIFPAHNLFLLLPGILMTAAGVWLLSLIAAKRMGRAASVSVILLSIFSTTVVIRIGLELRAYCLMFFAVCLVLYSYLKEGKKETGLFLLRLLASLCLIYSHYYGVLFFALWGVVSLIQCIRKAWPWKKLIPQICAGLMFLPWFLHTAKNAFGKAGGFWIEAPSFRRIPEAFGYLMGSSLPMLILYALCCIFVFLHIIKNKKYLSMESFCLFAPYVVVLGMFVYSRYLSGGGGLFLNKYFTAVLPCVLYTTAAGIQLSCAFLWKKKHLAAILWMAAMIPALYFSARTMHYERSHIRYSRYSGCAKILREAGDLSDPRTMFFLTYHDDFEGLSVIGMYDYYLLRRGTEAVNMECFDIHDLQDKMDALENIDKVYVFCDDDMVEYDESAYRCIWQDGYYCLTIFEKR